MEGVPEQLTTGVVVANKALVSIPGGTGRLTRLTVGTSLKTLVVVDVEVVTGTAATEICSTFGVTSCTDVVTGSGSVTDVVSTLTVVVF